jgi:hypothetical protein
LFLIGHEVNHPTSAGLSIDDKKIQRMQGRFLEHPALLLIEAMVPIPYSARRTRHVMCSFTSQDSQDTTHAWLLE